MKNFVGFALSVLALAWAPLIARGEASFPVDENLDPGWRFIQSDPAHAQDESFDDSAWRVVNLPHDYSVEGEYRKSNPAGGAGAYLPGGVAWYRRTIEIPDDFGDKLISVWFDAAARNSDVYINGKHLGSRPYAYISFSYDLTPRLHPGKNILAVRLDTSAMPASRWYTGSGLYAHVHLLVTDRLHFDRSATFITTSRAATNSAEVRCDGEIVNATGKAADARTTFQLLDESGAPAASVESSHHLDPGKSEKLTQSLHVDRPKLWSPDSSYLYTLVARISLGQKLIDEQRIPVGIRTVHWDANTGFWINERNVKIKGVAMHYDAGGLGNAIPDQVLEARLRLLKAMGANAIRTGHTPFPPHFYDLCDRLGFLVMDEAFDGWRKKAAHDYGAENFKQWWRRDLADLVVRDRNHPSVILWSIGNETGDSDRLGMSKLVHDLDPTRATTGGQVLYGVGVSGFMGRGKSRTCSKPFTARTPGSPSFSARNRTATRRAASIARSPGGATAKTKMPIPSRPTPRKRCFSSAAIRNSTPATTMPSSASPTANAGCARATRLGFQANSAGPLSTISAKHPPAAGTGLRASGTPGSSTPPVFPRTFTTSIRASGRARRWFTFFRTGHSRSSSRER